MKDKYIDAKTFKQFSINQDRLINILNHRMTGMEESMIAIQVDVGWTKKILMAILGTAIVSLFTILIKLGVGI